MKKLIFFLACLISVSVFGQNDNPNRILIKVSASTYDDISQLENPEDLFTFHNFNLDNRISSVMIGLRTGFGPESHEFSSNGRDKNRGNVYGLFYNQGLLSDNSQNNLYVTDNRYNELQIGYIWKEFFKISYGKGSYEANNILENIINNSDYSVISSGINLRLGRITTDLNISLLTNDNFKTVYSRIEIGLGLNFYLLKQRLNNERELDNRIIDQSNNAQDLPSHSWSKQELAKADLACNMHGWSQIEKSVLLYTNLVRLYPQRFLQLEVYKWEMPNRYSKLNRSTSYYTSLVATLKSAYPRNALTPSQTLHDSALCFAIKQGKTSSTGHDRSGTGCPDLNTAENCDYGMTTGIDVVMHLLIDEDVSSLGHRKNILNSRYKSLGVGFATHAKYGHVTVQELK